MKEIVLIQDYDDKLWIPYILNVDNLVVASGLGYLM